jgi:hypothetical protein
MISAPAKFFAAARQSDYRISSVALRKVSKKGMPVFAKNSA